MSGLWARSYAEALATPGPPPLQDIPACLRGHPLQEPVSSLPFYVTGLKCHLHRDLLDNSCLPKFDTKLKTESGFQNNHINNFTTADSDQNTKACS